MILDSQPSRLDKNRFIEALKTLSVLLLMLVVPAVFLWITGWFDPMYYIVGWVAGWTMSPFPRSKDM